MTKASKAAPKRRARAGDGATGSRRDGAVARAKLLEKAMQEFADKGLDARIEDISDAVGTNRRMAYYYFGSKEGLYLAALEATYLELVERERVIDVDALGPLEALAALVSAKFEHFKAYPRYVQLLKIENIYRARHLKTSKRIDELRGPLNSIVSKVVKRGQELGVMRQNIDPLELYVAICALGFYAFSNQYTLGTMFGTDLMAPAALKKRKQMMIDMVTAYVTSGSKALVETANKPKRS
jgi:TetR/AcrR family transcriptional regulator